MAFDVQAASDLVVNIIGYGIFALLFYLVYRTVSKKPMGIITKMLAKGCGYFFMLLGGLLLLAFFRILVEAGLNSILHEKKLIFASMFFVFGGIIFMLLGYEFVKMSRGKAGMIASLFESKVLQEANSASLPEDEVKSVGRKWLINIIAFILGSYAFGELAKMLWCGAEKTGGGVLQCAKIDIAAGLIMLGVCSFAGAYLTLKYRCVKWFGFTHFYAEATAKKSAVLWIVFGVIAIIAGTIMFLKIL